MSSVKKKLLIVAGAACLLTIAGIGGVFLVAEVYRYFHPYLDRTISGPVTITQEWTEIVPNEPLKAERQIQYLTLDVAEPFEPDYDSWGLRLPDGAIVVPEVQLIDQNGNIYKLTSPALDNKGIGLRLRDLPKDRVYRAVRIRADKPIKVSRIYWHCYNQRDVS